jgi:hypothetical protein
MNCFGFFFFLVCLVDLSSKEHEAERELEEFHQFPSSFQGLKDNIKNVRMARKMLWQDRNFLVDVQTLEFEQYLVQKRKDKAVLNGLIRMREEIKVFRFFFSLVFVFG